MAKSTKNAAAVCLMLSVIGVIGAVVGIFWKMPMVVIAGMLPAVVYEVYRTEGITTKLASLGICIVIIAEFVLVFMKTKINIASFVAHYIKNMPVIDATLAGPVIMALLAIMLLRRTAGVYTKWLAVLIFACAAVLFYTLDPSLFGQILKPALREGLRRM